MRPALSAHVSYGCPEIVDRKSTLRELFAHFAEPDLSLGDVAFLFADPRLENIVSVGVLGVLDPTERFVLVL